MDDTARNFIQEKSKELVTNFIYNFKACDPYLFEVTFTQGYCYFFAVMLKERFTHSQIWYNPELVHFATYIDNVGLCDITGIIPDELFTDKWIPWEEYKLINKYNGDIIRKIEKECIYK